MVRVRYSFGSRHTGRIGNIKKQRGKYPDVMRDVVRISDIVLEVLDARFIEETRNLEVEEDVLAKGKVLVYVLNKCDLISWDNVKKSLLNWMKPYVFVSATKGIGLKDLRTRIKIEAKRILSGFSGSVGVGGMKVSDDVVKDVGGKRRVHIGVIGYPNTGKSSLINIITRRGAAKTAKQAGFTKGMQKIKMSDDVLILDTPGVISNDKYSSECGSFARDVKVGARTYSDVKNPEDVVFYLMVAPAPVDADNVTDSERVLIEETERSASLIEGFYKIKFDGDVEKFIESLGRAKGFLARGGKIDVDRTARLVLRDWQEGRIIYRR